MLNVVRCCSQHRAPMPAYPIKPVVAYAVVSFLLMSASVPASFAELKNYGVLKARLIERGRAADGPAPHYQIHAIAAGDHYRIAFTTASQQSPTKLRVAILDNFVSSITSQLQQLRDGPTRLSSESHQGLDYIRGGLFHIGQTEFL